MINKPGRFAFVDAGEAARMLGIDRVTLEQWIRDGRIKPHRGVGRDSFFRTADLEALYKELHPAAELAEAIAADPLFRKAVTWQNLAMAPVLDQLSR